MNANFSRDNGEPVLIISRLQGFDTETARENVRLATREFYACRPSNLLVNAARNFADITGCKKVLLVSNKRRVSVNLWRKWNISANYDQLWEEIGGSRRADHLFEAPTVALQQIDFEAIASKKRSEAKKKAALLDDVYTQMKEKLLAAGLKPF